MHPTYYHQAHACVLVFDVTRKVTYKNLAVWYKELRHNRPEIPCILVANKIDGEGVWLTGSKGCGPMCLPPSSPLPYLPSPLPSLPSPPLPLCAVDYKVTQKSFNFARKNHLPFYFVSASDGTNVVKVSVGGCGWVCSCACVCVCVRREYMYSVAPSPHWQVFKEAIKAAVAYKENSTDIMDAIMRELEVGRAGGGGAVCGMAASCA